jgi:hypothetical protein
MPFVVFTTATVAVASSFGSVYELRPFREFSRPSSPSHQPAIRVLVPQPDGWRRWDNAESSRMVSFVPNDTPTPPPGVGANLPAELVVTCQMSSNLNVRGKELENPRHASLVLWMSTGTKIQHIKKETVFEARRFGKLPIWLIQGEHSSYYLVVVVRDGVQLEIGLRADNEALGGQPDQPQAAGGRVLEELKKHDAALKQLVRSIRIVKPRE